MGDDMCLCRVIMVDGLARIEVACQLNARLRDDLDLVTELRLQAKRFSKQPFTRVATVNVGMVERRDAELDARLDEREPLLGAHVPFGETPHAMDDA